MVLIYSTFTFTVKAILKLLPPITLINFFLFCFFNPLTDGKVVLPENLLAFSFYGKLCNVVVMKVKGTDSVELHAQAGAISSEVCEPDLEKSDLEMSALDLSLQLSRMDIDEDPEAASASTPCKPACLGSPVTPSSAVAATGQGSAQGDEASSREDAADLELPRKGGSEGLPSAAKPGAFSSTDTFYYISSRTRINFIEARTNIAEDSDHGPQVTYDMIGGLSSQLKTIRETVELPLKRAELFKSYGTMLRVDFLHLILFFFPSNLTFFFL